MTRCDWNKRGGHFAVPWDIELHVAACTEQRVENHVSTFVWWPTVRAIDWQTVKWRKALPIHFGLFVSLQVPLGAGEIYVSPLQFTSLFQEIWNNFIFGKLSCAIWTSGISCLIFTVKQRNQSKFFSPSSISMNFPQALRWFLWEKVIKRVMPSTVLQRPSLDTEQWKALWRPCLHYYSPPGASTGVGMTSSLDCNKNPRELRRKLRALWKPSNPGTP